MSASPRPDEAALRARLDTLAARGRRHIRIVRRRRGLAEALRRVLPALLVVPATVFLIQLVQAVHGDARWSVSALGVLVATALFAVLWMIGEHLWLGRRDPGRRAALGVFDTAGAFADRLNAADEFLGRSGRSDFMQAAIDDAARFADRAAQVVPEPAPLERPARFEVVRFVGAAALLCVFVGLWGQPAVGVSESPDDDAPLVADAGPGVPPPPAQPHRTPRAAVSPAPTEAPPDPTRHGSTEAKEMQRAPAELSAEAKKTKGRTGAGQASDAESTSGANDSRGTPSNQAPASVSDKRPKKRPRPVKKPTKDKPSTAKPPPKPSEDADKSASTSGRGSSKGSNKNPVGTDWKSKDQVDPDDEEELADDEEVEDEDSDSEARGGMQPTLRDRKPPVSRDLTVGFGNRPSPDANGRGGPSEQKKSRGTASLVLGVPIPDRVKGQPNPGKTKVTQERVEPRRETSGRLPATARAPRSSPVGRVAAPRFSPWLRELIRSYFLRLRSNPKEAP